MPIPNLQSQSEFFNLAPSNIHCRLYKTVFPNGLDDESQLPFSLTLTKTITQTTTISHLHPIPHITSSVVEVSSSSYTTLPAPVPSLFGRWTGSTNVASTPNIAVHHLHHQPELPTIPDGLVEELVVAGTAFGFGLFNLVFSLLPKKVQGLVGFLGFKHDRKLALRALSVAASKKDVHGVFAGCETFLVFCVYSDAWLGWSL